MTIRVSDTNSSIFHNQLTLQSCGIAYKRWSHNPSWEIAPYVVALL